MERVKENGKVQDYRGRLINLLDDNFRLQRDCYLDLLKESGNDADDPCDVEYEDYFRHVFGVVINTRAYSSPTGGTAGFPTLSPGECLDDYQAELLKATADTASANAQKATALAKKEDAQAEMENQISKMMTRIVNNDVTTTLDDRVNALFRLRATPKDVLSQAYLDNFLGQISAKNTKGFKL
jgi:hypothetical protein